MRIDRILIENFKLFEKAEFRFHPQFNLVVGVNGSGKTSLLRALSVALGGWAYAYIKDRDNRRPILPEEVREIFVDNRWDKLKKVRIEAQGPATIVDKQGVVKNATVRWWRSCDESASDTNIDGKVDYGSNREYSFFFVGVGAEILRLIESGKTFDLPLIAFYECDRLWLAKDGLNAEASAQVKYSRFDPFKDCFHTGANHKAVGEWLIKNELASLQKKEPTPVLQAIRLAARNSLEGCTGIRFDIDATRVLVEFENGKTIPFEHLSDGQRTVLGLFSDLARRATILNPHLGDKVLTETPGVVLIDELDLHLHPKWQRVIIENLRQTFPKVQFICTTHSPFLIQSLRSGEELVMIDGQPTADLANMPLEEIARGIMGVSRPEISARYEKMQEVAKHYLETLEEAALAPDDKKEEFKKKLAEAIEIYADNPAYQAFLEMKRAAKLGE